MLELKNINIVYDRPVLKNVNAQFENGKMYVIKGVSGCGKSTLLNILGGLENGYEGEVLCDGKVVKKDIEKPGAAYIFQYSLLLSGMTVLDNLLMIDNSESKIRSLACSLGVDTLLMRQPAELSGGERQRISILRALLQNPRVLLADEPTASLDDENSKNIALILANLRDRGMTVIAVTHENYLDDYADVIMRLDYGDLSIVKADNQDGTVGREENTGAGMDGGISKKPMTAFWYVKHRNKKLLSFRNNMAFMTVFLLMLLVSTVENCFDDVCMDNYKSRYPVDGFAIQPVEMERFAYTDVIKIYDEYRLVDGEVTALYLPEERDSVLSTEGMIQYGVFPENESQVIISHDMAAAAVGNTTSASNIVGKELEFMGVKYTVSGVLYSFEENERDGSANENFELYYNSDVYYTRIYGKIIYIPYEKISKIGDKIESDIKRASIRNLFDNEIYTKALRTALVDGTINIFDEQIQETKIYIDFATIILAIVFAVCFVLSCLFFSAQIGLEMFYRRRELGYLQIFGVCRARVKKFVGMGYMVKYAMGVIYAFGVYVPVCVLASVIFGDFVVCNPLHVSIMILLTGIIYVLFVKANVGKFLKHDIVKLIT